ncbi:hypothetical protein Taro_010789 [Colocasia esculenta]|uniref:Uncharacterized protein n=1 Tax=Colocasia esculenta TaxID=4460 RepID=A0A843U4L6_COLES|nr:hypothetical protein [Colocasia esculenta]
MHRREQMLPPRLGPEMAHGLQQLQAKVVNLKFYGRGRGCSSDLSSLWGSSSPPAPPPAPASYCNTAIDVIRDGGKKISAKFMVAGGSLPPKFWSGNSSQWLASALVRLATCSRSTPACSPSLTCGGGLWLGCNWKELSPLPDLANLFHRIRAFFSDESRSAPPPPPSEETWLMGFVRSTVDVYP